MISLHNVRHNEHIENNSFRHQHTKNTKYIYQNNILHWIFQRMFLLIQAVSKDVIYQKKTILVLFIRCITYLFPQLLISFVNTYKRE